MSPATAGLRIVKQRFLSRAVPMAEHVRPDAKEKIMKKSNALKLHRDVIRLLTPAQGHEVAGGSGRPTCFLATGPSCDCTQICTG
jgi:hypothetical protein